MKVGKRQSINTLINEEALLFARFLREDIKVGHQRLWSEGMVSYKAIDLFAGAGGLSERLKQAGFDIRLANSV